MLRSCSFCLFLSPTCAAFVLVSSSLALNMTFCVCARVCVLSSLSVLLLSLSPRPAGAAPAWTRATAAWSGGALTFDQAGVAAGHATEAAAGKYSAVRLACLWHRDTASERDKTSNPLTRLIQLHRSCLHRPTHPSLLLSSPQQHETRR